MRQFIIAAALALGLVALWAAILPLTAQPAPSQATVSSPAMSKALFLCRGPNGIDRTCAAALAKALVLDAPTTPRPTPTTASATSTARRSPASIAATDPPGFAPGTLTKGVGFQAPGAWRSPEAEPP